MHITSIGIDLGKTTFHLVALGEHNKVLLRKKFSRSQLLVYTANPPSSLIGLEACAGSHFLGAALREQGHQVRLIPAQFVKPYRKSNRNDFLDAEAIAEAVTKQNMRFAQLKTQEQLDWQALHRVRDRLVQRRTALINEIRGFLLERAPAFRAMQKRSRTEIGLLICNHWFGVLQSCISWIVSNSRHNHKWCGRLTSFPVCGLALDGNAWLPLF
jgi:transposase